MDKQNVKSRMDKSIASLQGQLLGLRAGRVTPALVNKVAIEVYGSKMSLNQLANIGVTTDGRTIVVDTWDKSVTGDVLKSLQAADLGANPVSDGGLIRLPFPPLSEERRNDLVKLIEKYGEEAKISIRNIRRDEIASEKKAEKDGDISEDELRKNQGVIQDITDEFVAKIDDIVKAKCKDILDS